MPFIFATQTGKFVKIDNIEDWQVGKKIGIFISLQ